VTAAAVADATGPSADKHILDNPSWAALHGPHSRFAEINGQAARYQPDVAPFVALPDHPGETVWTDLAALVGSGTRITLFNIRIPPPADWEVVGTIGGVQLIDEGLRAAPDPDAELLGPADVPEMLDLVARTRPGPFLPRTVELGRYLGIRRGGALIAMAGERVHPPGWTEISAVCTDEPHRGQGLATRLIRAVAAGIRDRGETPFLHASATNRSAIRLYESLGFVLRREATFLAVRVP
jgi:ribosomal protein S18 acetylase RimI-like enzyme